jgi:hypothetical protein
MRKVLLDMVPPMRVGVERNIDVMVCDTEKYNDILENGFAKRQG